MAEYGKSFSDKVSDDLSSNSFRIPEYTFNIDPEGFKMPPVLDVLRFMANFDDPVEQEKICRKCLMDRTVRLKVDGELAGTGFTFTDMNAPWDIYPEIKSNPLALKLLMEITGAFVLKNSMPSQKTSPVPVPTQGTQDLIV